MKKLMFAVVSGLALATVAADWQVYSFTQTGKAVQDGKVVTVKTPGLAVYEGNALEGGVQVCAVTWGTRKDTEFTTGSKAGKKAYTGKVVDAEFFLDPAKAGAKIGYGYTLDSAKGYGFGTARSVKGNFVGEQCFGTWQLKFDIGATRKYGAAKNLNAILEAKNVEVLQ